MACYLVEFYFLCIIIAIIEGSNSRLYDINYDLEVIHPEVIDNSYDYDSPLCSDDFELIKIQIKAQFFILCVTIISADRYQPKMCPQPQIDPIFWVAIGLKRNISLFSPYQRQSRNHPFEIKWDHRFLLDIPFEIQMSDDNCIIFSHESRSYEAKPCDSDFARICAKFQFNIGNNKTIFGLNLMMVNNDYCGITRSYTLIPLHEFFEEMHNIVNTFMNVDTVSNFENICLEGASKEYANVQNSTYSISSSIVEWCETYPSRGNPYKMENRKPSKELQIYAVHLSISLSDYRNPFDSEWIKNRTINLCQVGICQIEPAKLISYDYDLILDIVVHAKITNYLHIKQNIPFEFDNIKILGLQKVSGCLAHKSMENDVVLTWPYTDINQTAVPLECSENLVTKTCLGDYQIGGYWSSVQGTFSECDEATKILYNLPNLTPSEKLEILLDGSITFNSTQKLNFATDALINITQEIPTMEPEIYVSIMEKLTENEDVLLKESQLNINVTDKLLYGLDLLLYKVRTNIDAKTVRLRHTSNFDEIIGWNLMPSRNLVPIFRSNISHYNPLAILSIIINDISKYGCNTVVAIFENRKLFNSDIEPVGEFMGFVVQVKRFCDYSDEYPTTDEVDVSIITQKDDHSRKMATCVHWEYGFNEQMIPIKGFWMIDEKKQQECAQAYSVCNFMRAAHYSMLFSESNNNLVLYIVSMTGTVSTIVAVVFFCGLIIKTRKIVETNNLILIIYLVIICLVPGFLYLTNYMKTGTLCKLTGVLLHFVVLCQFAYALILALLQCRRIFFNITGSDSSGARCVIIAPLISAVIVGIFCSTSLDNYSKNCSNLCYLSGSNLLYGVFIPILIIISLNLIIFIAIIIYITSQYKIQSTQDPMKKFKNLMKWCYIFILLSGICWIFGILYIFSGYTIFEFCFTFLSSFQGLFISICFIKTVIAGQKKVRKYNVKYSRTTQSENLEK